MILLAIFVTVTLIFLLWSLSELLMKIISNSQIKREEEEAKKHDCNYCCFFKDGKCQTNFEEDCKSRNYFIWYPKDKN